MKILLLGMNGQVGWELQRSLAPLGEVVTVNRRTDPTKGGRCGDLCDLTGLVTTVREVRPNVIVNAAAYTAVDKAEDEPDLARLINALAPAVLADEAAKLDAWLVHYSTDYVFDGKGEAPWTETNTTAPINIYGKTKCEGEKLIQSVDCKHLILRTSWVYGARGGNFAKKILSLAQERDHLMVVNDQWGAPTGAELLADVTAHLIRYVQARPTEAGVFTGIYHLAAAGVTNWHEYAQYVIAQAQRMRPDLGITAHEVFPVPTSDFVTRAQRPHNSRLATRKMQDTFRITIPAWQRGVDRMLEEFLA